MKFSIDVNVNVTLPGVLPFLHQLQGNIMSALTDALKAASDATTAEIGTLNSKVDTLIGTANSTKAALVALQQNGGLNDADSATVQSVIDALTGAVTTVQGEEAKVDAANTADAP